MKLLILQAGIYNNERHRAVKRSAGDIHETAHDYGSRLVEVGFAELWTEKVFAPEIVETVELGAALADPIPLELKPVERTEEELDLRELIQETREASIFLGGAQKEPVEEEHIVESSFLEVSVEPVEPEEPVRPFLSVLIEDADLGRAVALKLIEAGYESKESLREASTQVLLGIKGIGLGTLRQIRAFLQGEAKNGETSI